MSAEAHRHDANRRRWIALAVVCLAMLMNTLDGSVVNVALPAIGSDLHIPQNSLTWIVNAYLIAFGSFLLMAGRMGDLVGRKRVFLTGVAIFTIASALCGFAGSETTLIIARFLQGFGGAVSSSVIIAMIVTEFPEPAERAKAMSAYIFVAVGGGSIGLLVGGIVTQASTGTGSSSSTSRSESSRSCWGGRCSTRTRGSGSTRASTCSARSPSRWRSCSASTRSSRRPDHGWGSAHTLAFGAASLALLALFGFLIESRVANPIMPLRILRVPGLASTSIVRGLLATGLFSTFFLGALYLERVRGYSALRTGVAFLPLSLVVGALSAGITANLMAPLRCPPGHAPGPCGHGRRAAADGAPGEHTTYFPGMFFALLILGIGAGTAFIPLLAIAMEHVPSADAGLASGIVNVSLQMSGAIGLAVLGTISTDHARSLLADGHSLPSALTSGYQLAFLVGAACVALGAAVALVTLRTPSPSAAPVPASGAD